MSLRLLLILMGVVSALMVAAVVYRKVLSPGDLSVGERRSLERICELRCAGEAEAAAGTADSVDEVKAAARTCLDRCVTDLIRGRDAG